MLITKAVFKEIEQSLSPFIHLTYCKKHNILITNKEFEQCDFNDEYCCKGCQENVEEMVSE